MINHIQNEGREKLKGMIDTLHASRTGKRHKPRNYREKSRKQYLSLSKQRRPGTKKIQNGIQQQLGYVHRNIKHVTRLAEETNIQALSHKQYQDFLVIQELYRQQKIMFDEQSFRIEECLVSISQPHVRPIVRGKTNASMEFGSKISVSLVDGYTFLDVLSWTPYHEGKYLQDSVETYKQRYGYYPEAVLADTIYRTQENRIYCKKHDIRLSGPKLRRAPKDQEINREQRRVEQQDASERNAIEYKFEEGKRRYR